MYIVRTANLKKVYGKKPNEVHALRDVSLEVEQGCFLAVVGQSGSGKSTFLHLLGGLDSPTEGSVWIEGKDLSQMKREQLTVFRRRHIGFVFQSYNLVPILNVYENIVLPLQLDNNRVDEAFLDQILEVLGLREKLSALPGQLSGGQQQRVAIARALITKPSILLADEPTGNLDSQTSQDVAGLLKLSSREFYQTVILITHNEAIAQLADRIVRFEDGLIVS